MNETSTLAERKSVIADLLILIDRLREQRDGWQAIASHWQGIAEVCTEEMKQIATGKAQN